MSASYCAPERNRTIRHWFRFQEEHRAMRPLAILTCAVTLAGAVTPVASSHDAPKPYEITVRMPVGGEGGWDYLVFDAAGHRLFVTRGSHVQVVDTGRGRVIGDIPNTPGVHGVALVPEVGHGFTSNGRNATVTVFDLKTLGTLANVKLSASGPDAIIYEPISKRVFTFNGGSDNATAIDPTTNHVAGSVSLDGRPEFAVADGRGLVYVNLEDRSAVVCFDARSLRVLSR